MGTTSQLGPRPKKLGRSPAYPRALGVGAVVLMSACGGGVNDNPVTQAMTEPPAAAADPDTPNGSGSTDTDTDTSTGSGGTGGDPWGGGMGGGAGAGGWDEDWALGGAGGEVADAGSEPDAETADAGESDARPDAGGD